MKKIYTVNIPLTYEVAIDTNDEWDSIFIKEFGIETVVRNKAKRLFLLDTSSKMNDSKDMQYIIRQRVKEPVAIKDLQNNV